MNKYDQSGSLHTVANLPNGYLDAFGRQRTSDPVTLFDSQQQYDANPLLWEDDLTANGTATHNAEYASVDLAVTTASGDKVIRQTRQYLRYQPGKSQLVLTTFVMSAAQTNLRQRVGYFDGENGIFLELNNSALRIVRRTNVSGTPVDNVIEQAAWNINTLPELDITKSAIFVIDLQWLGVGEVRCGFEIDGNLYYVHHIHNANNLASVYMTTANLPVRYEIEATGTLSGAATMQAICCSVISEGGFESNRGVPFSVGNGITGIAVTTRRAILSIRPKATFNSIVNRGEILLNLASVYAVTDTAYVELVYGATLGGTPSWSSVGASSIVEYDIAGTTVTGGITVDSFYVPASGTGVNARPSAADRGVLSRLPLTLDIAGANPINLSIVCTAFTGTSTCSGSLTWGELR